MRRMSLKQGSITCVRCYGPVSATGIGAASGAYCKSWYQPERWHAGQPFQVV